MGGIGFGSLSLPFVSTAHHGSRWNVGLGLPDQLWALRVYVWVD